MPPPPDHDSATGRWLHGKRPVLGLIGGIGAGKSRVAALLADRGVLVLDADTVGHALLDQRPSREAVVDRFGEDVLDPDDPSRVDRKRLGRIVFDEPIARRALESILHPRMRRTFERAIGRAMRRGTAVAVAIDAAILIEAGWDDLCDAIVFVDAPEAERRRRVLEERRWSHADFDARQAAQAPLEHKRSRADFVIVNDGKPERLSAEVDRLLGALKGGSRGGPRSSRRAEPTTVDPSRRAPTGPRRRGAAPPRSGRARPGRPSRG